MEASTLIDPRVVEAATSVVPVVAHGPLEHGTFEAVENGKKVTRCRLYRNLDCSDHQGTHEALKPYQKSGRFRIPFTVWIDPEGQQLFRRDGWRRPDEFLYDIRLALEKVKGPHRTRAEYAALVRPLDEAREALAERRYAAAVARFEEAKLKDAPEIRSAAEEGLKEIEAAGNQILAAARVAVKSARFRQARPALDEVARQFSVFECGRQAVELFREVPCPLRELTLRETGDARGGANAYLRGDGHLWIQVVSTKDGAPGLHERRYQGTIAAGAWDELAKQLPGTIGMAPSPLAVRMWTGTEGFIPPGRQDPTYDAVRGWLGTQIESLSKGKAIHEGPYDASWRPEGFPADR